ncbi:hypothetical protein WN943_022614 [Citrus x changshan-huyou]
MRDAIDGEEREGADGENGEEGRSVVRLVACHQRQAFAINLKSLQNTDTPWLCQRDKPRHYLRMRKRNSKHM